MKAAAAWTHAQLVAIACKWAKYPNARGGHGCQVAVPEPRTGWGGESPDVLGFRHGEGTVVVECKTSRADFLADRAKPHRAAGGIGDWRYFMAPEGLIKTEELPSRWGLLEVNRRGSVNVLVGVYQSRHYAEGVERSGLMRHESCREREMFVLTRLLCKVQDPEAINEIHREKNRLATKSNTLARTVHDQLQELSILRHRLSEAQKKGYVD